MTIAYHDNNYINLTKNQTKSLPLQANASKTIMAIHHPSHMDIKAMHIQHDQ